MYTVVIADDEEEIRRSLIRKIDWEGIGFQVVGEASNGEDALELVEKLEPDLLLTDVKMPFVTGIELARQVREIRPTMQIAFLSGYDDFSYAQQAIQYNIISYMLKPISSEELAKELLVIRDKMERKFRKFAMTEAEADVGKSEFLTPLILDGFQRELSEEEKEEVVREALACRILEKGNQDIFKFTVIVTSITDQNGNNKTTRTSLKAIDSILGKYVRYASIYTQGKIISLLMATKAGFHKYLHILVEDISQSVNRIMGYRCTIGVSRIAEHISSVHGCYLEAMSAVAYSGHNGNAVHFIGDEERMNTLNQEYLQNTINDLENLLRGGTEQEVAEYLNDFFGKIEDRSITGATADFVLLQIASVVFQTLYVVTGYETVEKFQQKFPMYNIQIRGNLKQTLQYYMEFCQMARKLIAEQRKKSSEVLCERILRIINERYMDANLSLAEVSGEVSVSPNYLSALMKKDTGSTFKDLLTRRRIKAAEELLLGTAYKVREVAEKCGYNDQHYFSYCFKKYTGQSPNQCRRIHEENKQE